MVPPRGAMITGMIVVRPHIVSRNRPQTALARTDAAMQTMAAKLSMSDF